MASIERRDLQRRDKSGRVRTVTRYKVRYRDLAGRPHSETKRRLVEAERRKAEIELELGCGTWLDPRRGEMRLGVWAADWLLTRHDLRATTHARLATTLDCQVLPRFGSTPLAKITKRRSPRVGGGDAGQRSIGGDGAESGVRAAAVPSRCDGGSTNRREPGRSCPVALGARERPEVPLAGRG